MTTPALLRRFFDDEADDYVRRTLLAEAARRETGRREFTFNVVDVLLDFDARTVTLSDVLTAGTELELPMDDFLARLRASRQR